MMKDLMSQEVFEINFKMTGYFAPLWFSVPLIFKVLGFCIVVIAALYIMHKFIELIAVIILSMNCGEK